MARLCASCGASLGEKARFCKACGAAVLPDAPSLCAYCGAEGKAGAKFCNLCGAPMEAAPDIVIPAPTDAEVYITDEMPVSAPTCPDCGAEVRKGAAFCKICGAALTEEVSSPKRRPATRTSSQRRTAPKKAAANGKRRRVFPRLVATVLIAALIITGVRHYNFFWRWDKPEGGYTGGGYGDDKYDAVMLSVPFFAGYSEEEIASAPVVTSAVAPDSPIAHSGEVTVAFGALNLPGACTLYTQTLPLKTGGDGGSGQEFRFTLTEDATGEAITEFALPVHITLPKGEGIPMIYYRDPQTGTDELIPSEIDDAAGSVTFVTDHFSGFWKSNLKADGAMAESTQYLFHQGGFEATSPVYFCDAGVDKLIWDLNLDDIVKAVSTKGMTHEDGVTLFITAADTAMDADEARQFTANLYSTAAQPALKSAAGVFRVVGPALLAAKVSYQLYHGSDLTTVILDNGADIVENMLVLCAAVTGAPPLLAAATAVFAANAAYTAFATEPEIPDVYMYTAYNTFNNECVYYEISTDRFIASTTDISGKDIIKLDFGGSETARALRRVYNHYRSDPAELNRITGTFMERYVDLFFNEADQNAVAVRSRVYADATYNDGKQSALMPRSYARYTPSAEETAKYVSKGKESLTLALKPIFDGLTELAFLEGKQALMDVLQKELLPYYNKVAVFELIDPSLKEGQTFESSVYAARSKYRIDFATPELRFNNNYTHYYPDLALDPHNFYVTPGGNEVFRCVNYLYWEMSCPTELMIRKLGVDEEIIYVPFDFNDDGVTTIVLPPPEPEPTPEPTPTPTPEPTIAPSDDYLSGSYSLTHEDSGGSMSLQLTISGDRMTASVGDLYTFTGNYSVDNHIGWGSCTQNGVTVNVEITLYPEESPVAVDCWFADYNNIRESFSMSGHRGG